MRKFFDAHVHCDWDTDLAQSIEGFKRVADLNNVERRVFMSVPHISEVKPNYLENPKNLFFKQVFSPNAYAYAGLEHHVGMTESELSESFYNQVKEYLANGFDGIKILEGKPSHRQMLKYKLSDKVYDKMFSYLEEKGVPITMHNADPIEFWDASKMSDYAKKQGWGAGEMTKLEMHEDVATLMKNHPKLHLSLAHLGFYADEKKLGESFLGDYEFTMLDATPGCKQYVIMSEDEKYWKDFFVRYQDRVKIGTDNCNLPFDFEDGWFRTVTMQLTLMRNFFETDWHHKTFIAEVDRDFYKGIKLDDKILDKIYYQNAINELGEPSKINLQYLIDGISKAKNTGLNEKQIEIANDMLKTLSSENR